VFGLAMFLFLLLLASQVLLHLYSVSVVTSVAFDTARQVAAHGEDCGPDGSRAEEIARSRLGTYGRGSQVHVACEQIGDLTTVTVTTRTPARGLATAGFGLGLSDIRRTASLRTESPGSELPGSELPASESGPETPGSETPASESVPETTPDADAEDAP
jgi:hypothetical protein